MTLSEAKLLYIQGQQKLAAGDLQGAIAKFQQALEFNPKYYLALARLGDVMHKLKRYELSLDYYNQALEIKPDYREALYHRGNVLQELKRYSEAIASYKDACKDNPKSPNYWASLGITQIRLELYEDAVVSLNRVLELKPKEYIILHCLGVALHNLGRYEEAITSFDQALGQKLDSSTLQYKGISLAQLQHYDQALASFENALQISPDNYKIWINQGEVLFYLEKYREALGCFDYGLRLNSTFSIAWANRALVFIMLNRYEEAVDSFDRSLSIDPDNYQALYSRAIVMVELGRFEEALENLSKVLKLRSNLFPALVGKADVLLRLGKYREAVSTFNYLLNLDSSSLSTWEGILLANVNLGDEELQVSQERSFKCSPTLLAFAYFKNGFALNEMGHYEEAIESYDNALRFQPQFHLTWMNKGVSLISLGLTEQALANFNKALEIKYNDFETLENRSALLYSLRRYQEALESFDAAISIDPNVWNVHSGRGSILEHLDFYDEALAAHNRALEIDNQHWQSWVGRGIIIWRLQGYEAALMAFDEAFLQFKADTPNYSENCGYIYYHKALIYYREGRFQPKSLSYWSDAISFYDMALKSFERPGLEEIYLTVLQDLIQPLLGLGRNEEADLLLNEGTARLQRLLDKEITPSPGRRKIVVLKFAGFEQLTVDRQIQAASQLQDDKEIKAQLKEALETAERGKNTCLSWLLYALSDEVASPDYEQMQQLLSPGTAIAYWHLSPAALTTFVLKPDESAPIVITTPSTSDRPESLQRLLKLEAWMKDWDDQYRDYRNQDKDQRNPAHSWRKDMAQRLFERQEEPGNLKEILNIAAIEQHLDGIDHLILIPHRDLHRFPLHALFSDRLTISYLPSIQVGLTLQPRQSTAQEYLFSVENPTSADHNSLGFARIEAEGIYRCFDQIATLQEKKAGKTKVKAALANGFNVFHFAGHAEHIPHDPKKSRLVLAPEEVDDRNSASGLPGFGPSSSPHLTLEDLQQCDLSSYDLVTLSACETAITNNQTITAEYAGLVSGFLQRGVSQVVSTLWTVESAASALVMIEFYRRRQPNKSDAVALAEAVTWLKNLTESELQQWWQDFLAQLPETLHPQRKVWIKQTLEGEKWDRMGAEKVFSDPYYWAAFTISGRRS